MQPIRSRRRPTGQQGQKAARWIALLALAVGSLIARFFLDGDHQPPGRPAPPRVEGQARPIDGDSFRLGPDEVRLKGIDAPEGRQTCQRGSEVWLCGEASKAELSRLIDGRRIDCKVSGRDRHDRLLGRCYAGSTDLNSAMVSAGMAVAYGDYAREETEAKIAKRGLWGSEFETPRAWRQNQGVGGRK